MPGGLHYIIHSMHETSAILKSQLYHKEAVYTAVTHHFKRIWLYSKVSSVLRTPEWYY